MVSRIQSTHGELPPAWKSHYQKAGRLIKVEDLIKKIIKNSRNDKDFIHSLGQVWGEDSRQNKQLKKILERRPRELTPKVVIDPIANRMKNEAESVIMLVRKGFRQIDRPIPQEIQRDITLVESLFEQIAKLNANRL